jgi:succinyl-CoA synthetase beta subunit
MQLNEYQTKQLFERFGIPVPRGRVASNSREVGQIAEELGGQVVLKAQVLVHGRGRLGGILIARTAYEAEQKAMQILGMILKGFPVHKVLVDELIPFSRQYYISIETDRHQGIPRLIAYSIVNVNNGNGNGNAREEEDRFEQYIDPLFGLNEFQIRDIAIHLELPREHWAQFQDALEGLWKVYWEYDGIDVEMNPLVISDTDGLIMLDGTVELDDKALFRHIEVAEMRDFISETPLQNEARKFGFNFFPLSGSIGTISNGAGLAMATVDAIQYHNGSPANYLDAGACRTPEKVALALRLALADPNVKVILMNFFGGISDCSIVAHGILQLTQQQHIPVPIILRVMGEGADEARLLLAQSTVKVFVNFDESVHEAIQTADRLEQVSVE